MLGKAMRFVAICVLAFAVCGKTNRGPGAAVSEGPTEDLEHRVGQETNLSTSKTVPSTPMRRSISKTGSPTRVRRLTKILLLAFSLHCAVKNGRAHESTKAAIEAKLLGLTKKVIGRTYFSVEPAIEFGLQRLEKRHKASLTGGGLPRIIEDMPVFQSVEGFLVWWLTQKGKFWDPWGKQEALAVKMFKNTPGWLVRAYYNPSLLHFMATHVMVHTPHGHKFEKKVKVMLKARVVDKKLSQSVQYINEVLNANPEEAELEEELSEDVVKSIDTWRPL